MAFSQRNERIKPAFKLWFEIGDEYVFGEGAFILLDEIRKKKSISAAARVAKMSYRHAWGLIREIERHLGGAVIETKRGGKSGGRSELTNAGHSLLADYQKLKMKMSETCNHWRSGL